MSLSLSIIIPTRNRMKLIPEVLNSLADQSQELDSKMEIIIINDGSNAEIKKYLEQLVDLYKNFGLIRLFHQDPKGPAAARNLGIKKAEGESVLFLGDDIIPCPGLLKEHLGYHSQRYPGEEYALLGLADLAPEFCLSPFSRWWRLWNFRYDLLLEGKRFPDYSFFYTNNLSLKRNFLMRNGLFDEDFRFAAYEDGELGFRLINRGLKFKFAPEAKAYHHHEITLQSACQRMYMRGKAYDLFIEKTGRPGISKKWLWLGSGPWMRPSLIYPLYKIADQVQDQKIMGHIFILVLMLYFQAGRGKSSINKVGLFKPSF